MADLSDRAAGFIQYFKDNEKTHLKKGFQNLEGVTELNELLNHPSDSYSVIHIAGSKGKGSTAHLISGILQQAGFRVGLFTSPHIHEMRERIQLNDEIISVPSYNEIMEELSYLINPHELKKGPSFFDLFTMAAFLYFKKNKCDFAVIETGLGGLFDSTNIVNPVASVITSLELEHKGLLGDSLEEIARHKCGIIKKGAPVFTGIKDPSLHSLIREKAEDLSSRLYYVPDYISLIHSSTGLSGTELTLKFQGEERILHSKLIGTHQIENILLAFLTVTTLVSTISFNSLSNGIARTRLPGRFEIVSSHPPVIFDVAHTAKSVRGTMEILEKEGFTGGCLIFSCCSDKEIELIVENLGTSLRDIYITSFDHTRCASTQKIHRIFQAGRVGQKAKIEIKPQAKKIYEEVLLNREKYDYILVMGSFFLLAQMESQVPHADQS